MRRPTVAAREKKCSAGISLACEPRQLPLCQQDLCWLEAGATFFLTTVVSRAPGRTGLHENTVALAEDGEAMVSLIAPLGIFETVSHAPARTQAHENAARAGSEFSLEAALIGAG